MQRHAPAARRLLLSLLGRQQAPSPAGAPLAPALAGAFGTSSTSSTRSTSSTSSTSVPSLLEEGRRRGPEDGRWIGGVGAAPSPLSFAAAASAPRRRLLHTSAPASHAYTMPSPTQLDAVMRTETLESHTADEIEDIWMAYHGGEFDAPRPTAAAAANDNETCEGAPTAPAPPAPVAPAAPSSPPPAGEHCVGSVLSASEYKALAARAKASPMFVLPLRKTVVRRRKAGGPPAAAAAAAADAGNADADGASSPAAAAEAETDAETTSPAYLTLLLQWQLPLLLFTTVDEYRRLGPEAPPHLVATFYPQLAESKGLVLARADITGAGGAAGAAVASRTEARALLELARAFYTDTEMHQLAYKFNNDQGAFDFAELLRALGLEGAAPVAE